MVTAQDTVTVDGSPRAHLLLGTAWAKAVSTIQKAVGGKAGFVHHLSGQGAVKTVNATVQNGYHLSLARVP
jgi:hypothetical protein